MKRLLSLAVALIMILSVLPFAAFAEHEVEPFAYTTTCSNCGKPATIRTEEQRFPKAAPSCTGDNNPMVHTHERIITTHKTSCSYCGYSTSHDVIRYYCSTKGRYINADQY